MKKSFFIFTAFLFCFQISGMSQKSRVGVQGGFSVAHLNTTINGTKEDNHSLIGLTFGMLVDVPVSRNIVFRPNLNYVQKGKWLHTGGGINRAKVTDELRHAEMSLNFLYKISGGDGSFYFGLGPSVDFNVPSKRITKKNQIKTTTDINFGNTNSENYRGFNYGANILAGVGLSKSLFLAANYNQGLRNLFTGTTKGKIRSSYFGLQLGYLVKNK